MSNSSYRGSRGTSEDFYSGSVRRSHAPPPADLEAIRRAREEEEREKTERAERVRRAREEAKHRKEAEARPEDRERRDTSDLFDPRLVRNKITKPDPSADEVTIIMVDNSGSNREVAQRMRDSSGYMLGTAGTFLGQTHQLAFMYVSDHCDNDGIRQDVDFVFPNEVGDKTMFSTTSRVHGADGGDEAEAFECTLLDACQINFGHIPKEKRHLILVTDVVGHGMGMASDQGCPHGRNWHTSVERVYHAFGTFHVVGTGHSAHIFELQAKFLRPERVAFDLIDLSSIREQRHRLGIVPNAVLFLMARNRGSQLAKAFLKFLYEKWLTEPIFGQSSDLRAREAITRFFKYIEGMTPQMQQEWADEIIVE